MRDAPPVERPWGVVKRMRVEGQPRSAIQARLAAMGLSSEDANVLLMEDPPKGSGDAGLSRAAAAVALWVISIGLLFGLVLSLRTARTHWKVRLAAPAIPGLPRPP